MSSADSFNTENPEAVVPDRSVRPVIEHALTVYFDGNEELARTLVNRLLNENQSL